MTQEPKDTGANKKPPTAKAIQAWLVSRLSQVLQVEPQDIDIHEPFTNYGLTSVDAVGLSGDLEDWLKRQFSPTLAYEYPTIETLARHLAGEPSAVESTGMNQETGIEPIAIVGIGCRFPGAKDPEAFWRLLHDGLGAITEVPVDRWDINSLYDPNPGTPGRMSTRWGGFLEHVDQFDPHFFGISPREASRMDPQQRLLLEVTWEALEDAGQAPHRLTGSQTGVFIGISGVDYSQLQIRYGDFPFDIDAYAGTGNAHSVAANRLSYLLDLRGPRLAVDTACSSSLLAVHLAVTSLRRGESDLALAGGVNLLLSPVITMTFDAGGGTSPDGRCRPFDAAANGMVRGEGCGVVVLKRLPDAVRDGDRVLAVITGTAVNSDGRSNGLVAPNGAAQRDLLRAAHPSPGQVDYVEAHGTGTPLGDPIEARALGEVLGAARPPGRPLLIGSVKSNVGHLEAAAGIAGLIKAVLAVHHRQIPATLHFTAPSPHIPLPELGLDVVSSLTPWPDNPWRPAAGVSAFGFSG